MNSVKNPKIKCGPGSRILYTTRINAGCSFKLIHYSYIYLISTNRTLYQSIIEIQFSDISLENILNGIFYSFIDLFTNIYSHFPYFQ